MDEGLQSAEFNSSAYFKAENGELFFGGINGVTSFFPSDILDNPNNPIPQITGISLFNEAYKANTPYWNIHQIDLLYTENSLGFEFSQPEFTSPQKAVYSYKMDGVDKQWVTGSNSHFARYAGLRPGTYTFMTRAANADSVWSLPRSLLIHIAPPFWQRGWFVFLTIIVSVSIVATAVWLLQKNAYNKKLRAFEIQQKIQTERERISRDLHDNLGSQLSLINKHIKDVAVPLASSVENGIAEQLDLVYQGSTELVDILRETIWALNRPEITLEQFADNLKAFIQKKLLFSSNLSSQFFEDENNRFIQLSSAEALNLFRICQEVVTNNIKYAQSTEINITIKAVNGKYHITITDNGIGFNLTGIDKSLHNGLENMKFRVGEIAAMLNIQSVKGRGTTISIIKQ